MGSEPFAFSRWGDGEWSAVLGIGTANCDGQAYAPLRDDLRRVLLDRPSYLLGMQPLAMARFGPEIRGWLTQHDLRMPWLNADVFHDLSKSGELPAFVEPLRHRPVILVGPKRLRALSLIPHVAFVEIPDANAYAAIGDTRAHLSAIAARSAPGTVVALSAGMGANVLIHDFAHLPLTWIDFGSVWEPYVGVANRRYHRDVLTRLAVAS